MEVTKWLKPSDSVSRIGEPRLPLWVKIGSPAGASECPLLGVKQKLNSGDLMSACRQTRAFAAASEGFMSVTVLLSTVRLRTVQAAEESG